MFTVLIADNAEESEAEKVLQEAGFSTTLTHTTTQAAETLQKKSYDFIISELSFSDKSGYFLLKFLRKRLEDKTTPFIFVSRYKASRYIVKAFKLGANDYIIKPFINEELVARVNAHLRVLELIKNAGNEAVQKTLETKTSMKEDYSFGPFTLSYKKVKLEKEKKQIPLTLQEFKLLAYLIEHKNQAVRKEAILDTLWKYDITVGLRTVYTHMSWLREKLKTKEKPEGYIKTIRQVGYMFIEENTEENSQN